MLEDVKELDKEKMGFTNNSEYYSKEYTWNDDEIIIVMEIEIVKKVLKILSCSFPIDTKKVIEKLKK